MPIKRNKEYYKSIAALALPITLGNILTYLVGLSDHIMTSSLGSAAVSGIYLANQVGMLLQFISVGIESSLAVLASQYRGKSEEESADGVTAVAFYTSVIFSTLLTIICFFAPKWVIGLFTESGEAIDTGADFLRILSLSFPFYAVGRIFITAERTKKRSLPSLISPAFALLVNIALNFLLIRGAGILPALGARGAAISTLMARAAECALAFFLMLARGGRARKISSLLKFDKPLLYKYIKCAIPIMAGQLVWAASNFYIPALMTRTGGGIAAVAMGVTGALNGLVYTLMNGASSAVGVITARKVGRSAECGGIERNDAQADIRAHATSSQLIFLGVGALSFVAITLLKEPFISLYRLSAEDAAIARTLVSVIAISFVGTCYSAATLFGIIKSGGDVHFVLLVDLIFFVFLTLPAGLIASGLGAPAWAVLAALKAEHILKCPVAAIRARGDSWIRPLARRWGTSVDKHI